MSRRKKGRPVNGWLVLDKPAGLTSTHAVNAIKRLLDARKAGHAGTLDPLATGILPIGFGEATKTMNFAVDSTKGYRFTVQWGSQTDTDDAEGAVTDTSQTRPTLEQIENALDAFRGDISQIPPQYSAIKVDGQRAYDLARDGEDVALQARTVVIHDLRIVEMPDDNRTVIEADCGKGTYVRAIARDLGRALGCLGHVESLRRTRVGPFSLDESVTLAELEAAAQAAKDDGFDRASAVAEEFVQPVSASLRELREIPVSPSDATRLRRGQAVILRGRDAPIITGDETLYATAQGQLVALGEVSQGSFVPSRVFNLS